MQLLHPSIHATRLKFSWRMLQAIEEKLLAGDNILFTDEGHFYFLVHISNENMRYRSKENLWVIEEQPLQSPVWMSIASFGVIGPYFFDSSVNEEWYRCMFNEFLTQLKRKRKLKTIWFQQDEVICHMANETMLWLQKHVCSQVISCNSEFSGVAIFYLWGFLKLKVYVDKPRELAYFRTYIQRVTREITPALGRQVICNFKTRLENCVKNKDHLKDVIFKMK